MTKPTDFHPDIWKGREAEALQQAAQRKPWQGPDAAAQLQALRGSIRSYHPEGTSPPEPEGVDRLYQVRALLHPSLWQGREAEALEHLQNLPIEIRPALADVAAALLHPALWQGREIEALRLIEGVSAEISRVEDTFRKSPIYEAAALLLHPALWKGKEGEALGYVCNSSYCRERALDIPVLGLLQPERWEGREEQALAWVGGCYKSRWSHVRFENSELGKITQALLHLDRWENKEEELLINIGKLPEGIRNTLHDTVYVLMQPTLWAGKEQGALRAYGALPQDLQEALARRLDIEAWHRDLSSKVAAENTSGAQSLRDVAKKGKNGITKRE